MLQMTLTQQQKQSHFQSKYYWNAPKGMKLNKSSGHITKMNIAQRLLQKWFNTPVYKWTTKQPLPSNTKGKRSIDSTSLAKTRKEKPREY